jgi:DNA-binding transcriptional MocR family regulator
MIIGTFAPIPNKILCRRDLSHGAKLCCARLIQYAGKDGQAYPKLPTLAEELGMSVRAVQRFVIELEGSKLIQSKRRGKGQSNLYYVDKSILIHRLKSDTPVLAHLDTPKVARPDAPELADPYKGRRENHKKELEKITNSLVYKMRMPR